MKLRKELWFGLSLMAIIVVVVLAFMPWSNLLDGHLSEEDLGYLGLLIASFTYYRGARRIPTTFVKIAMIVFCITGMFVGSIFDLGVLKTMATVFFAQFVLELPAEVRPENVTAWACTGLVIATMGWLGSLWVKSNMDLVGYWLTF